MLAQTIASTQSKDSGSNVLKRFLLATAISTVELGRTLSAPRVQVNEVDR